MQLDFDSLRALYKHGAATPSEVVAEVYDRIAASSDPIWISTVPREKALARARKLEQTPLAAARPLYGVPFAIKDNIDLAGMPTTAACPAYAYTPRAAPRWWTPDRGRRDPDRQDQPGPVRDRPGRHALALRRLFERVRPGTSPADRAPARRWRSPPGVELCARHRHRRLGPRACRFQQPRRIEADPRPAQHGGVVPACRTLDCVSFFAGIVRRRPFRLAAGPRLRPEDPFSRAPDGEGAAPWLRRGLPLRRTVARTARVLRRSRSRIPLRDGSSRLEPLGRH